MTKKNKLHYGFVSKGDLKNMKNQGKKGKNDPAFHGYLYLFLIFEQEIWGEVDCLLTNLLGVRERYKDCSIERYKEAYACGIVCDPSGKYCSDVQCSYRYVYRTECTEYDAAPPNDGAWPSDGPSGGGGGGSKGALPSGFDPSTFDPDPWDNEPPTLQEINLAIKFPFEAKKILDYSYTATARTNKLFGRNGRNDCSDAFRHAYWMALNAQEVGANLARQFGIAHESRIKAGDPEFIEKSMDLHNNNIGIVIGQNYPNSSEIFISSKVIEKMRSGYLQIINSSGNLVSSKSCL